jgi:hypothetical protein
MARARFTSILATAVCLLAPAYASATDRYVTTTGTDSANSCMFPNTPCFSLQEAVNSSNPTGDTIHIGPGTYGAGVASTSKDIDFEGAGAGTLTSVAGATVINVAAAAAFTLTGGGTLRNLQVAGGASGATGALTLQQPGTGPPVTYTLANVIAIGNGCSGCRALEVTDPGFGAASLLTANITDSTFLSTGDGSSTAFIQNGNANFARTSVLSRDSSIGGLLIEFGALNFSDGAIGTAGAGGGGAVVGGGATATLTRARLAGFQALLVDGGLAHASASVVDSVGVATLDGAIVRDDAALSVRGSTFVAEGTDAVAGADIEASPTGDVSLNSVNSIFRVHGGSAPGFDIDLAGATGHAATFTADHSSYTSVDTGGGTATPAGSATNIAGDPGFMDEAGGDFRLAAGSPLIDRGSDPLIGETDVTGVTRAVDGNCDGSSEPDIGGLEFIPACPPHSSPPALAVLSKVHMTHKRFRVGKPGAARAPKGTRFVYTLLGNGAKVTVTIDRPAAGRKKGKGCVKLRRGLHRSCTRHIRKGSLTKVSAIGRSSLPFSGKLRGRRLAPGRYRATLVAVNAAGGSRRRHLSFTIVRR